MSAFQTPSLTDLVKQINAANGTNFALTDLSFSNPKVVSGTWQGISSDRNTAIRASAASAQYQGNKVILYNRLDLAQLANLPGLKLAVNNPSTTWDILPQLAYYLGIKFVQGDLQNLPISLNADGTGQVQLAADPNSVGWQGSVMLNVTKGGIAIDTAIAQPTLPGLNYPVSDAAAPPATATQGPVYLYPYDFTSWQSTLLGYAPGVLTQAQADFLKAAINTVDVGSGAGKWTSTQGASTIWQLYNATIVSNGLNNSNTMPTNPNYKYVLALQLDPSVTTPSGTLYLHYNDPFNPNSF